MPLIYFPSASFGHKKPLMKNILILIVCLISLDTFAKSIEVDVISTEFGVADHLQNNSLCLTVVRVPADGSLLGVVEGIQDCFYARAAKKSADHKIQIDMNTLRAFSISELHDHLQTLDGQLKFLFSEGE
jgi:hypothetical protein